MNPPDALLHLHWVPRNIDMDEAMCTLQIDAFGTSARGNNELSFAGPETFYFHLTVGICLPTNDQRGLLAGLPRQEIRQSGYGFNRLSEEDELITSGLRQDFIPDKLPLRISHPSVQLDTLF